MSRRHWSSKFVTPFLSPLKSICSSGLSVLNLGGETEGGAAKTGLFERGFSFPVGGIIYESSSGELEGCC